MEEASVAGESPDRSKQRESSAEQTSGSAGPVPEKQDPRLAVARGAGDSEGGKKADTATRVLSVPKASASEDAGGEGAEEGDGRLREAVAAWVRSAEPGSEASSEAPEDASVVEGDEGAEEGAEPAAGGETRDEGARGGGAADEDAGTSSKDAGASSKDAGAPSNEAGASGDVTEDAAASDGAGRGDAPEGEDAAGETDEAPADAPNGGDGKADARSADAANDVDADQAGDAKGDAETDGGKNSGKTAADAAAKDDDAAGKGNDEPTDKDGDSRSTGKTAAGAAAKADADADADKSNTPANAKNGDASEGAKATDRKGTAKPPAAERDEDGAAPKPGETGSAAKGDEKTDGGTDTPVDQPTAVFRAPRPAKPAVDQPTTMLKLGDAAARTDARAAEAERTSKFVALKPDPAIGQTPRQGGPAAAESTTFLPQVGPERTTQQPLPPKPPLDLLAELTNTPPPPQTPLRTAVRRIKIWTPLAVLLVIVFAVVQNFRPLPTPTLVLTAQDTYTFEGGKPQIPWPESGQAALDVDGIGTFGSSGEQKPVPIASVAKVMTAYVILRDHPLKSGAEGPKIEVDALAEQQSDAGQESTVNVTQGDAISEREAVEAILIASANNVARLLARWDAGSEKAFVEKMNEAAEDLGMSDTTYTDPSGLNNTTVSTAVDQVKLARAAMQQPAFREVAAMMEYVDYKGEKHGNWNRLVGKDDVVGIKTGTTTSALGNLSFAAKKDVDGEVHRIVGAVLRQPEGGEDHTILSGALDAGHKLILAGQDALRAETILKKGTVVGYADDGLGGHTPVVVTEDVKAVGWAGLEVKLTFAGTELPHTARAGTKVGTLTVGDGKNGAVKVPVALKEDLVEPGFTDKLTRVA
ncbi:D-alanyl-D-alanine carboxypeptidase [Streptomyces sp. McG8]|uniref:D-alanyl-D-alanine carboxypeptidase n=1 Tax=Streptomyces sp. McG8 TaxID=2725487 RepID=UPI00203693E6